MSGNNAVMLHDAEVPIISAVDAQTTIHGTAIGGICVDPHTVTISWTITGDGTGFTIRIKDPSTTVIASGLSCVTGSFDDVHTGEVTSAGTGHGGTYVVDVLDGGSNVVSTGSEADVVHVDSSCIA